jgi:hypothetical protein
VLLLLLLLLLLGAGDCTFVFAGHQVTGLQLRL